MATNNPEAKVRHPRRRNLVRGFVANIRALQAPDGGRTYERGARREFALAVLGQFRVIFRSSKKHFHSVEERAGVSGAQLWLLAELYPLPPEGVLLDALNRPRPR